MKVILSTFPDFVKEKHDKIYKKSGAKIDIPSLCSFDSRQLRLDGGTDRM